MQGGPVVATRPAVPPARPPKAASPAGMRRWDASFSEQSTIRCEKGAFDVSGMMFVVVFIVWSADQLP